jgi:mRNA capping enzyme
MFHFTTKSLDKIITGGSAVHRLEDHVTKRDTLNNVRPNITSHIYFSTDRMGRFSRGSENYNMHFQGAIHLGIITLSMFSFRDMHHITGCVRKYAAPCYEEKLPDFVTPIQGLHHLFQK